MEEREIEFVRLIKKLTPEEQIEFLEAISQKGSDRIAPNSAENNATIKLYLTERESDSYGRVCRCV